MTHPSSIRIYAFIAFYLGLGLTIATAQQSQSVSNKQVNLVFGIGQITQGGFNVEGNLFLKRLAFDYSHGVGLQITRKWSR